jgi:hypothetical protein
MVILSCVTFLPDERETHSEYKDIRNTWSSSSSSSSSSLFNDAFSASQTIQRRFLIHPDSSAI